MFAKEGPSAPREQILKGYEICAVAEFFCKYIGAIRFSFDIFDFGCFIFLLKLANVVIAEVGFKDI